MQMHVIGFEPSGDLAGPYTDPKVLEGTLKIILEVYPRGRSKRGGRKHGD